MFKDDLVACMEKENVTPNDLADYLGTSVKTVYNWRSGSKLPIKKHLDAIIDLFNLPKHSYDNEIDKPKKTILDITPIDFGFNGGKLVELRKRQGLSQTDLGSAIGVAGNTISAWEHGTVRPSVPSYRRLCCRFGVHEDYFKKPLYKAVSDDVLTNDEDIEKTKENDERIFTVLEERLETLSKKVSIYENEVNSLKDRLAKIEMRQNKLTLNQNLSGCAQDAQIDILAKFVNKLIIPKGGEV